MFFQQAVKFVSRADASNKRTSCNSRERKQKEAERIHTEQRAKADRTCDACNHFLS